MPILNIYVDERTMRFLELASSASGRPVSDLAEAAVSEAAIDFARANGATEARDAAD